MDWSRPLIPAVVDDLVKTYSVLGVADLRDVIVVFPSKHGLKRFDDLWVRRTGGVGHPPRRITVGTLPEELYQPQKDFASELIQKLAWGEAVRGLPRQRVELVLGHLPKDGEFDAWLSIGELLWRVHLELAADGLDFGDVAEQGAALAGFRESPRWRAMQEMQKTYHDTLDALGLWDQQTARLVAIERKECETKNEIVLVGAADINVALRSMLDQVAEQVTAYIHAPESWAGRFDAHGCLIPDAWEQVDVKLHSGQLHVVDGPIQQAQQVVECLRGLDGRRRMDEITIGIPDERLLPVLRRVLKDVGVPSHRAIETTLRETSPFQLLKAIAAWLESRRPVQFAELVRHPAVTSWLAHQGVPARWIIELDDFLVNHLQCRLGSWPAAAAEKFAALKSAYELATALLGSLSGDARLLSDWTDPVTELLLTVYSQREFDAEVPEDRVTLEGCRRIWEAMVENQSVPESIMPAMESYQALHLTLNAIGMQAIPPGTSASGVDLLGWLDLAQDDNPVVILTNFNEEFVPSSVNSDLFLPNSLRQHLGLTDNARRFARDVHALSALLHSRQHVSLIVGRRDVRNDPLIPSRLLFATDEATIAARIRHFYGRLEEANASATETRPLELLSERTQAAPVESHRFQVPRPDSSLEPLSSISVTAFRLYLACPYRFYLKHVLKLESVEQDAWELSPLGFGNLLHAVLDKFGKHPASRSSDETEIEQTLESLLDETSVSFFGVDPLPVVRIQLEQAAHATQGVRSMAGNPGSRRVEDLQKRRDVSVIARPRKEDSGIRTDRSHRRSRTDEPIPHSRLQDRRQTQIG